MINKRGPKAEPWGTPLLTREILELMLSTCKLFSVVKIGCEKIMRCAPDAILIKFTKSTSWLILSKALERSRKTVARGTFWEWALFIRLIRCSEASDIPFPT